jgi:hypothetical protein
MQEDLRRLGVLQLAGVEAVRRLVAEAMQRLNPPEEQRQHPGPACRSEEEEMTVRRLVARIRRLPEDQRRQVPALLVNLEPGSGLTAVPAVAPVRWVVLVTVDANLYGSRDPAAPTGQPARTFLLPAKENLIGREGSDFHPEILIENDPGVSRHQALLLPRSDGTLVLRDLNSANGTLLNGQELIPGVDTPVKDGDTIALGAWTRIAVRAVTG